MVKNYYNVLMEIIKSYYKIASSHKLDSVNMRIKFDDYDVLHNHDYFELFCTTEGKYKHQINGKKEEFLSPGDGYLIRPDDYHKIKSATDTVSHLNILIKEEFFEKCCNNYDKNLLNKINQLDTIPLLLSQAFINKLSFLFSNYYETKNKDYRRILEKMICNQIIETVIEDSPILGNRIPQWFKEILNEINQRKNLSWKVTDVVNLSNYSKTHFERLFKQYTNLTIIEYLTNIKMQFAAEFLTTSNLKISEISSLLGYSTISHFNHLFKKYYKTTPLNYRNNKFLILNID